MNSLKRSSFDMNHFVGSNEDSDVVFQNPDLLDSEVEQQEIEEIGEDSKVDEEESDEIEIHLDYIERLRSNDETSVPFDREEFEFVGADFLKASKKGNLNQVRSLWEDNGAKYGKRLLEVTDKQKKTPLYLASAKGKLQVVQELLNCGAEPNSMDIKMWTPLWTSSYNGHIKVTQLLVSRGADLYHKACYENGGPFDLYYVTRTYGKCKSNQVAPFLKSLMANQKKRNTGLAVVIETNNNNHTEDFTITNSATQTSPQQAKRPHQLDSHQRGSSQQPIEIDIEDSENLMETKKRKKKNRKITIAASAQKALPNFPNRKPRKQSLTLPIAHFPLSNQK